MLTVYSVPHSLYCSKLRIMMRAKGLEFEEIAPPGGTGSPEYLSLVPTGNLPALKQAEFTLGDSEAIAEYLNEAFPMPPLLPTNVQDRARMRERGRFHDTRLEPALRALFPLVARPDQDQIAKNAATVSMRLGQLSHLLRRPLPFGLGDCGYPPTFLWIDVLTNALDLVIEWPQDVLDYAARLEAMPLIAQELEAYRPHADAWVASKRL